MQVINGRNKLCELGKVYFLNNLEIFFEPCATFDYALL